MSKDLKSEILDAAERESKEYQQKEEGQCDKAKPPQFSDKELQEALEANEFGDANLAVKLMRGRFCYDNSAATPYRFNCTHWLVDINNDWRLEVGKLADEYDRIASAHRLTYAQAVKDGAGKEELKILERRGKPWASRVKSLRTRKRVRDVWELAVSGPDRLGISGQNWNSNPLLFPCKNCVIDLETGKKLKGDPGHYFNRASGIEFTKLNAESKFWCDFLDKIFCGDRELREYFEFFMGAAITGIQTKDFFCAYGPTADNGKSMIFWALQKVLGEFAGTLPVETLIEEKFSRNPDAPSHTRLKLYGLRLAVTSEAQSGQQFSLAKIKQFTSGGDALEARGVSAKHSVEFDQQHTLVLHTNFLPTAKGSDSGFYTRLKVLPFMAKFIPPHVGPEDPAAHIYHQIPRHVLEKKIIKAAPAILAMCVRNAIKFLKRGDMPQAPPSVMRHSDEYRQEQDLVGQFLRECAVFEQFASTQAKYVYNAFVKWCMDERSIQRKYVLSQRAVGDELKARPELRRVHNGRVTNYEGIRLENKWAFIEDPFEKKS